MSFLPQNKDKSENHQVPGLDYSVIDGAEVCIRTEFKGSHMIVTFGDSTGYKSGT